MLSVLIIIKLDVLFMLVGNHIRRGNCPRWASYHDQIALGSLSLLDAMSTQKTKHAAYADDLSCADKLQNFAI